MQGTCSASGGESYSVGYSAVATFQASNNGGTWSFSGGGSASGATSYQSSYAAVGRYSSLQATPYGTGGWTVIATVIAAEENGSASGGSVYSDPLTISASGVWQMDADDQTLSSRDETVSDYSFNRYDYSGWSPTSSAPGPLSSASAASIEAVVSNSDVVSTSTTTGYDTPQAVTTALTLFGQGANGGTASEVHYNGMPAPNSDYQDSWSTTSGSVFQQSGSATYANPPSTSYGPTSVSLSDAAPGFSTQEYTTLPSGLPSGAAAGLTAMAFGDFSTAGISDVGPGASPVSPLPGGSLLGLGVAPVAGTEPAAMMPWPAAVATVWGMTFTPGTAPRTIFAAGNAPGASDFASETISGASRALGPANVAPSCP